MPTAETQPEIIESAPADLAALVAENTRRSMDYLREVIADDVAAVLAASEAHPASGTALAGRYDALLADDSTYAPLPARFRFRP